MLSTHTKFDDLQGPERAAVIILAVGEENSKPLWEALDDEELRELTRAISRLGSISSDTVDQLLIEFVDSFSQTGTVTGSIDHARRLLANVLPKDKVDTLLEDVKGPAGRTMWEKLANVSPVTLARYLAKEHPQTVAVILSRMKPEHAALVMENMPEPVTQETINRMLSLGPVQKEVLENIEQTLRTEFISELTKTQNLDCHEMIAEIFNNFDRSTEKSLMNKLEEKNPTAAEKIKSLMFVFDNLAQLEGHDIQLLLRHLDKSILATALKGANEEIKTLFFNNMSERASKILRDDIEIMRPLRVREVETAQQKIVDVAKKLSDEGTIYLSSKTVEEVIY